MPQRYDIILDNVAVGNSTNNWKTSVLVTNFGLQTLWATIEGRKAEVRINFQPGNVYYVRSDVSSRSVKTGKINSYKAKDGSTRTIEETITEYTPILQLMDKRLGESEFKAIVIK